MPGVFAADLDLTSAKSDLGSAGVGSVPAGWTGTFAGRLGAFATAGNMAGATITAASAGTLRVGGNLSTSTVTLTGTGRGYDLASLHVNGTVTGTTVRSAGNVNSVSVGGITGSSVFAGATSTVTALPTATADFATAARLNAFTVTGVKGATTDLAGTNVAAGTIGQVRVTAVDASNGGTPFGFAGETIASYVDQEGTNRYAWTAREGAAALKASSGDYVVSIV